MIKKIAKNVLICLVLILALGIVLFLFGLMFGFIFDLLTHKTIHESFRWFTIWYGICAAPFVPLVGIWTWRNERRLEAGSQKD